MSTVEELRRKFAATSAATGVAAAAPGGRPAPPRKPNGTKRPVSVIGGAGASSTHNGSSVGQSTWNSNNTSVSSNNIASYHNRNSQQQDDIYDNEPHGNDLPPDPPGPSARSVVGTNSRITQPSYPPPVPTPQQRQPLPPGPPRSQSSSSSWSTQISKPPPVPVTARPESVTIDPARGAGNSRPSTGSIDHTTLVDFTTAGKGVNYELCSDLLQKYKENEAANSARGGASRMGFGSDLQDRTAHESIVRLNDHEIKLMDTLKKVIQHKVKSDRDYATALAGLVKLSAQFNPDASITHSSPLVKSWASFIKETENLSKLIRQNADEMNNALVERLGQLIREKTDAKRQYQNERTKIDHDFQKAKEDVKENFVKYQKLAKETKDAKTKYEDSQLKSSKSKEVEKTKERFKKSVIKLHRAHNEYVLSLKAASIHQEHYRTSILPRLLECLQQTQESQVAQIKQILVDLSNMSNTAVGEFVTSHNNIMRGVSEIRPDQEYLDFVSSNKCEPQPVETFEFDITPMQEFTGSLEENSVVLDKLTLESFQHLHTSLGNELQEIEQKHKDKKQELQGLDEEIRSVQPGTSEEGVLDLLSKQKAYRDASREIQELRCLEAKIRCKYQMLDIKLSILGDDFDENELPDGIELYETAHGTLSRKSTSVSHLDHSSNYEPNDSKSTKSKKRQLPFTKIFKSSTPSTIQSQEDATREIPLDEEEWYHGALPRTEAEVHLVNDGDFVVREKSDASGQIVLSARAEGKVRHFPIQRNTENLFRLEGDAFPTVGELIRHQLTTAMPVTKASQAVLRNPVARVRDEHDMRHEEIELSDKLGAGHFGDVFRGIKKKDGTQVAVKTCKETVDASTRRKFLKEANILKQYHHANIVKLIGVCTDKHPIYIVMELVPGGDLLTFLRKDQTELTTKQMVKMGEDAAAGMAYLEERNCIHRDLAARNCLVGIKNVIKISDFGMSRQEEMYTIEHGTMRQIPIKWTAPEAMNFGTYTTMSDVWSFGILLWEVFSHGSTPYPGMNNNEAREKVEQSYRMPSPQGCNPEIYNLMLYCWKYESTDRPKFKEIHATLKALHKKMK